MGKGSRPRPMAVPKKQFDENFERIFGKEKEKAQQDEPKVEERPKEQDLEYKI